jgi:hypothetical protein
MEAMDERDDTVLDASAEVSCPHCGETVTVALDSGGGPVQEYVEDCSVCCRPWTVRVHYDPTGAAEVFLEPTE